MKRWSYPVFRPVDYTKAGGVLTVAMIDRAAESISRQSSLQEPAERVVVGPWKNKEEYEAAAKAYSEYLVDECIKQGIL